MTGSNTLSRPGPSLPDFEEHIDPQGRVEVPLASQELELDLQAMHDQAEAALKDSRE